MKRGRLRAGHATRRDRSLLGAQRLHRRPVRAHQGPPSVAKEGDTEYATPPSARRRDSALPRAPVAVPFTVKEGWYGPRLRALLWAGSPQEDSRRVPHD